MSGWSGRPRWRGETVWSCPWLLASHTRTVIHWSKSRVAGVDLGYFEDFKSSDTLLIECDAEGLRLLAGVFRSLQSGASDGLKIEMLPFVQAHDGVCLTARRSCRERVARIEGPSSEFLWEATEAGWEDAADKVEALLEHEQGHQYLQVDDGRARRGPPPNHSQLPLIVQVSRGEYGSDWWLRHG